MIVQGIGHFTNVDAKKSVSVLTGYGMYYLFTRTSGYPITLKYGVMYHFVYNVVRRNL